MYILGEILFTVTLETLLVSPPTFKYVNEFCWSRVYVAPVPSKSSCIVLIGEVWVTVPVVVIRTVPEDPVIPLDPVIAPNKDCPRVGNESIDNELVPLFKNKFVIEFVEFPADIDAILFIPTSKYMLVP